MIVAIIQARMGSTRLPGKVMLPLLGKPVLWHVVNRVMRSQTVNKVIVATTIRSEDDVIDEFCISEKIPVFRGSSDDVLDRYYNCAKSTGADTVIRITADCPLHDPVVIDYVISEYQKNGYDYVTNSLEYTFPDGLDVEVFSFKALEEAWRNACLPSEREHVTPYIRTMDTFKKRNVISSTYYPPYRFTLDNPEDYEFIREIYDGIGQEIFGLDDCVAFLAKNPHLLHINDKHTINEGYYKSLVADAKSAVIEGERIFLRHLHESDTTERYFKWLSDPDIIRFLDTKEITIDELRKYVRSKELDPACLFFGIFLKNGNKHIGNIKLEPIIFDKREAVIGILIGERDLWGKGFCTEAVKLIVSYAFSRMKIQKIRLGAMKENQNAVWCYSKAGFTFEAILPGSVTDPDKLIIL